VHPYICRERLMGQGTVTWTTEHPRVRGELFLFLWESRHATGHPYICREVGDSVKVNEGMVGSSRTCGMVVAS
jgi:hypothetical protein